MISLRITVRYIPIAPFSPRAEESSAKRRFPDITLCQTVTEITLSRMLVALAAISDSELRSPS